MNFLRYQEYQESVKFRKQSFTILEFMDYWSHKYGEGSFSYPRDFSGFNLQGRIIKETHESGIPDINHYDDFMIGVYRTISYKERGGQFYLIGITKKKPEFKHELAHGLFGTQEEYQSEMMDNVRSLPNSIRKILCRQLEKMGYNEYVYDDEIQAYMSTGLDVKGCRKAQSKRKPFINTFNRWMEKVEIFRRELNG